MATLSVILPGESPWTEEPGGLQSMDCKELDMTERLSLHFTSLHCKVIQAGFIIIFSFFFLFEKT